MDSYLQSWLDVIGKMANDNTYKLAWGRGIIECIQTKAYTSTDEYIEISFFAIAEKMLKYYWNQEFFFKLKQGPNSTKTPIIHQITEDVIQQYTHITQSTIPVWYDRAKDIIFKDQTYYQKTLKKLVSAVSQDVCWRFLYYEGQTHDIYELNRKEKWLRISNTNQKTIDDYGIVLTQLLNYKWAQLLEQFNRSPKIVSKVRGSQENNIKRKNLSKFKEILLKQFEEGRPIDFYTGLILNENDISLDHVIPWSFLYSDDIWNLVITNKAYNSSKSNSIPSKQTITRLIDRNRKLLNQNIDKKTHDDLFEAIHNAYVEKYFTDIQV
ncbi:MAG: HNH endonuclease domain-containing protein [Bacillota bacterium]